MSFSIVQSQSNFQATLNPKGTLVTNFPSHTAAGNLLLFCYAAFSGSPQDISITDNGSPQNFYSYGPVVNDDFGSSSGFSEGAIAWAGDSSQATGITLTNNSTTPLANVCVLILEINGIRQVAVNNLASPPITVADANPVDVFPFGDYGQVSPASPTPGAWSSIIAYTIDDIVSYSGSFYIVTGTPTVGINPVADPSNWIPMDSPDAAHEIFTTTADGDLIFVFTAVNSTTSDPIEFLGSPWGSGSPPLQENPGGTFWVQGQWMTQVSAGVINPSIPFSGIGSPPGGDWICLAVSFFS